MGTTDTTSIKGDSVEINKPKRVKFDPTNRNSDSAITERDGTGTTGTDKPTGAGTATTEKTNTLGLSDLEKKLLESSPKDLTDEEKNARRRLLYKAKKDGVVVPKPRKVNSKTVTNNIVNSNQLELLIGSVFTIIGAREGMEIWILQPNEIKSIAEPLSKIISKNEMLGAVSEHSDAIALGIACFTILVPRLMTTLNQVKEKKRNEITGNTTVTNVRDTSVGATEQTRKTKGSSRPVDTKTTDKYSSINTNLLELGQPTA